MLGPLSLSIFDCVRDKKDEGDADARANGEGEYIMRKREREENHYILYARREGCFSVIGPRRRMINGCGERFTDNIMRRIVYYIVLWPFWPVRSALPTRPTLSLREEKKMGLGVL